MRLLSSALVLAIALSAQAQPMLRLPADQFGRAAIEIPRGAIIYESTFNDVPNFEPLADFTTANRYRQLARSVGRLDLQLDTPEGRFTSFCTATLVAPDVILTNYHCVPGMDPGVRVTAAQLRMGYLDMTQEGVTYPVDVSPIEADRTMDFAVLKVNGTPGQQWGHIPLRVRDPIDGEELFILHHPAGQPQRLTRRNCRLQGGAEAVSGIQIRHRCDTLGGSSGSLLFSDNARDGRYEAVGLHYAGFAGAPTPLSYNSAKRLTELVRRSPTLRRLATTGNGPAPGPTPPSPRPTPNRPPTQPVSDGPSRVPLTASLSNTLASGSQTHTFEGQAGDIVTVDLTSDDFDPVLDVTGTDGAILATDDDSGGELNARITDLRLPTTGVYTFTVRSYTGNATGTYTLALAGTRASSAPRAPSPPPPPRTTPTRRTIAAGQAVNGRLDEGEEHVFTFSGQAGQTVTASVDGTFDSYLVLSGPTGQQVASDDDSGGGTNAEISGATLSSTGIYTLTLSPYQGDYPGVVKSGTYTVRLAVTGGASAEAFVSQARRLFREARTRFANIAGAPRGNAPYRVNATLDVDIPDGSPRSPHTPYIDAYQGSDRGIPVYTAVLAHGSRAEMLDLARRYTDALVDGIPGLRRNISASGTTFTAEECPRNGRGHIQGRSAGFNVTESAGTWQLTFSVMRPTARVCLPTL